MTEHNSNSQPNHPSSRAPISGYWPLWLSRALEAGVDRFAVKPVHSGRTGRVDPVATLRGDWRFAAMIENPQIAGQALTVEPPGEYRRWKLYAEVLASIVDCETTFTDGIRPGVCQINFTRPYVPPRRVTEDEIKACLAAGYPEVHFIDGRRALVDANGILFAGRRRPDSPGSKPDRSQIANALKFLDETDCVKIKTPSVCSYSLKHTAERWAGDYISNGAAIVAASRLGVALGEYPPSLQDRLNVQLGLSKRWYKAVMNSRCSELSS